MHTSQREKANDSPRASAAFPLRIAAPLRAAAACALVVAMLAVALCTLGCTAQADDARYYTLEDLAGKTVGCIEEDSTRDDVLAAIPTANTTTFKTNSDLVAALHSGRIDAFALDTVLARPLLRDNSGIVWLGEPLGGIDYAFVFAKEGERAARLLQQMNEFLAQSKADGTAEAIIERWTTGEQDGTRVDLSVLDDNTGETITVATDYTVGVPMCYMIESEPCGLDIDMVVAFCEWGGYQVEFQEYDLAGELNAVRAGMCDFACAGLNITKDRAENFAFSTPYLTNTISVLVSSGSDDELGFFEGLASSFAKTFLDPSHSWMIASGILTTLALTISSLVLGAALGFGVYVLCLRRGRIANGVSKFFVELVDIVPEVVILLILYYLVFGSSSLPGLAVAIISFTLMFGAKVFKLIEGGVSAVDAGQMDAALALGFSRQSAFFAFVLPQAMAHIFDPLKGEVVSLIKTTAVVGFIAVQDLTKIADIIRAQTFDAFFPLIFLAVVYAIIALLFSFIVSRIEINFNPRKRSRDEILKGIDGR